MKLSNIVLYIILAISWWFLYFLREIESTLLLSIRGDSEISEIMEHDLARRTYDRLKVLSPKMGLGGLKYPHFGVQISYTWILLPGGRFEMMSSNFGGGLVTLSDGFELR